MNQAQLKNSFLYRKLWEPNTFWTGIVMGSVYTAQVFCGAGLIFFSTLYKEEEFLLHLMGWWLLAWLPIQLACTAWDLKKKKLQPPVSV